MTLYLSLDPNICAEVVSEETLKSDLEEDNCNWHSGRPSCFGRMVED